MQSSFERLLAHLTAHKASPAKHNQLWGPCRRLCAGEGGQGADGIAAAASQHDANACRCVHSLLGTACCTACHHLQDAGV